jgi:hypothetical protein
MHRLARRMPHGMPSRQASATFRNNTLALWLTPSATAVSIT